MSAARLPHLTIVGRPNVGKSTLFNRIIGRRQAIVGSQSGLTRDSQRADADWAGHYFTVTDTGGLEWDSSDELLALVQQHALHAVEEADVTLLVVDGREGLAPVEGELAETLRRQGRPVILVVNKCDGQERAAEALAEFAELGIQPAVAISAEHGRGMSALLDTVIEMLPESPADPASLPEGTVAVAVVGRPNVGKSSLVNALLGSDRVIVSDVSGTTRDPIDSLLEAEGRSYLLVDTAGIRRGGKRTDFAENVSVAVARNRIRRADVALVVVDAAVGLTRQDVTIAAEAAAAGAGLIVVVNKWDLVPVDTAPTTAWVAELRERMGRLEWALFAFTSALTGDGVEGLLTLVDRVQANRTRRVPTAQLNQAVGRSLGRRGPPGAPEAKYVTQSTVAPPTFVVFIGRRGMVGAGEFQRYLENRLRENFDFGGTPVRMRIRKDGDSRSASKGRRLS